MEFEKAINGLPERHRAALRWFAQHSGTEQPWHNPLPDGTLLASKAKGIYKPRWSEYAISVRQSLGGPYLDRDPITRPDGTWSFLYYQENTDPTQRDSMYTNRGLLACERDRIPVGVFRQISAKPKPRYQILGVVIVAGWRGGYFFLEGFAPTGEARDIGKRDQMEVLLAVEEQAASEGGAFDPDNVVDARQRTLGAIVIRRGQSAFRERLIRLYGSKCAITECDAEEALEAAHILPYLGPATNHPSNGLLLRADIHLLFDLGLVAIDTQTMTVTVHPRLRNTTYQALAGKQLRLPKSPTLSPSKDALDSHRNDSGL